MGEFVDFKAVKAAASVQAVARQYGVNLSRSNASHERGKCPLPSHPAGDDTKSFSINTAKQVWICHSTACAKGRRGKKGGDVIEMVAVMESCSLRDAGLKLASSFGVVTRGERIEGVDSDQKEPDARPAEGSSRLGKYDALGSWIESRLASESLSRFEQSSYLSVLGKIEELVRDEGGGS